MLAHVGSYTIGCVIETHDHKAIKGGKQPRYIDPWMIPSFLPSHAGRWGLVVYRGTGDSWITTLPWAFFD